MTKILNYYHLYKPEAYFILGLITHPAIHKKAEKISKNRKLFCT